MTDAAPAEFVLALGALLPLAALVVSSFLGAYVLGLTPRRSANRSAFFVMLAFIIWDLGEIVQRSFAPGTSSDALFFWARVTWIGIVLVPATLYHLALTYPSRSPWFRGPWALAVIYAPFVFWAYLVTSTNLIISGMSANAFGPSARVASTYAYFAPFFGLWMFSSVLVFVRSWWRVRKTPSRSMQSVVVLGLILGTVPAAVTELAWPVLTGTDTRLGLGSLYTMMWSIFIAYAVARYRYLHIEPVVEVRPARAPRHRLE
ncbi:MAG TPA: histidine kinase N-terminal 7TM domain-containing protein, partial [Thermoplasmata archaeon]|nr:histidine kinase N-terminal 7TM domain-containing protein [Thermoplasmata archaeon]